MKRNLNIMIKPSSSKCNLQCKYCFYNSISNIRYCKDYGFMKEETIRTIVKKAKEYCNGGICTIGFQGGEPLLIGMKFYYNLVGEIENNNNGTKFNLNIQTNGTLLDEKWAEFFKDYNFLVGISLDGIKEINDIYRIDLQCKSTFYKVIKGIDYLKKYNVEFNILTVVTDELLSKVEDVYKFYKKNNFKYLQFIPYLPPLKNDNRKHIKNLLTADVYAKFLIKLFDMWYEDFKDNDYVSIKLYDNILRLFLGYDYEACEMRGMCSCQNIIESDGTLFPCDFYTYEKYVIGNILNESFEDIVHSNTTKDFINESLYLNNKCYECKYNIVCRGGCKIYRNKDGLNSLCESYYKFYDYSLDKFKELSTLLNKNI
ncbi:radical SAM protein [Haloimpatiens sp. FM7315]|uniref:radical SAM protein n=1 Tax=Haloimpatiens sp. FM7315 TaxID=3298609 RepID=UPI0035A34AF1